MDSVGLYCAWGTCDRMRLRCCDEEGSVMSLADKDLFSRWLLLLGQQGSSGGATEEQGDFWRKGWWVMLVTWQGISSAVATEGPGSGSILKMESKYLERDDGRPRKGKGLNEAWARGWVGLAFYWLEKLGEPGVGGWTKESPLENVRFEIPIRHQSGNVEWAVYGWVQSKGEKSGRDVNVGIRWSLIKGTDFG